MITQLSTVKSRLAILDTSYDDLLTSAIEADSDRFDRQCNRTFARAVEATEEFPAEDTEIAPSCYPIEAVTKFETKSTETEGWVEQTAPDYLIRRPCVISLAAPLNLQPSTLNSPWSETQALAARRPQTSSPPARTHHAPGHSDHFSSPAVYHEIGRTIPPLNQLWTARRPLSYSGHCAPVSHSA